MLSVDFDVRDAGVFPLTRQENCAIIESIRGEQDMDSEKLTPEELTEEELTEEEPTEEELEEARRRLYAHLAQAEEDIKAGRVHPIDEVFDEIMRELDSLSLDDPHNQND